MISYGSKSCGEGMILHVDDTISTIGTLHEGLDSLTDLYFAIYGGRGTKAPLRHGVSGTSVRKPEEVCI